MKKVEIKKMYDELHHRNFINRIKKSKGNEKKVFEYKLTTPWHRIVVEFLNNIELKNKKVLEIGCGYGSLSVYMAKKGAKVTGIDISSEAIKISKRNASLNGQKIILKQASGENISFKDQFFDLVVCCETLEHIPNYKKVIDEIIRVTKNSGNIIITTPNSFNLRGFYLRIKSRQPIENFFSYWTILKEFRKRDVKIINQKSKSFFIDYDKDNYLDELINKTPLKYLSLRVGLLAQK